MRAPINKKTYERFSLIATKEKQFIKNLGKNWLNSTDQKDRNIFCGGKLSNYDRSNMEVYEWLKNPPDTYFLYIDEKTRKAITWTGQILGTVLLGHSYTSNFGDNRQSISIIGINGISYYGTYYYSAGNYALIKQYKNQK